MPVKSRTVTQVRAAACKRLRVVVGVTAILLSAPSLWGQEVGGLPPFHPLNPVAQMRTGLYVQPYLAPRTGWRLGVSLDYGSLAEVNFRATSPDTAYQLDAEVLRLGITVTRDIGRRNFMLFDASIGGAYAGFLDGFLGWYHGLFGIRFPERDLRPRGRFDYSIEPPSGSVIRLSSAPIYLGDLRLGVGHRFNSRLQSLLSFTLPTNTGPTGYGVGSLSINLINTARLPLGSRAALEGSLGAGFTPTHGELAAIQREVFLMATAGGRYRFLGPASAYARLFYHTPYYHDTDLPALDGAELTMEFGLVFRNHSGKEWWIGMTEDPWPSGPAFDLTIRLGASFRAHFKEKLLHIGEQELLGFGILHAQRIVVDQLLLGLEPFSPAHIADLLKHPKAEFVLEGPKGELVPLLTTADACDRRHRAKIGALRLGRETCVSLAAKAFILCDRVAVTDEEGLADGGLLKLNYSAFFYVHLRLQRVGERTAADKHR